MSKNHKKVCATLFILKSISVIGLRICTIIAGIKKYKSIIKKKKENHDKIVLLAKCKLKVTKALISKASIDSNISHDMTCNGVLTHQQK